MVGRCGCLCVVSGCVIVAVVVVGIAAFVSNCCRLRCAAAGAVAIVVVVVTGIGLRACWWTVCGGCLASPCLCSISSV